MPSELNKEHLRYLESKGGAYYKACLELATKLAESREIKVVDLYGVKISYRGINDEISVVYDTDKNLVRVYKFDGKSYIIVEDDIELNFNLDVNLLSEQLLSLDKPWKLNK